MGIPSIQCTSVKGRLFPLLLSCTLVGCSFSNETAPILPVSGGKSAAVAINALAKGPGENVRPSGALGIFSTMYLAQGFFLSTESAVQGLKDILGIVRDQEKPLSDESFALLQTLGDTLSVDVVDLLNRSTNRIETLDRYTESLTNTIAATKLKLDELKTALGILALQKKERRTLVTDLTRLQKTAITAKDFSTAAEKEQELIKARTALSETELTESQSKDMQSRFKKLLDIAEKRKAAIDTNRQLLLSGLKVADIPGLQDLGIIEKGSTIR